MAVTIDGSGTVTGLASGNAGVGKVLQVVSVTKTDPFTTGSTTFVDVTGLTVDITPTSATSKILVFYKVSVNPRTSVAYLQLLRGETVIGGGIPEGARGSAMSAFYAGGTGGETVDLSGNFLDSPASTSSQTYKIQTRGNAGTTAINTTVSDTNEINQTRNSSTITVMEIAA